MNPTHSDPRFLIPLLAALSMLAPFAIDAFFPAFPQMGAEFGVGDAAMQQSLSVYLTGYALTSLLHGPLSDAYGRRGVVLSTLLLFVLATVGCASAGTLTQLLLFRLLQGLAGGAGVIVGRAIVRDFFEGAAAVRVSSQVTLIFAVAPAIAPIVGGWILTLGGWRAIFWSLAGFVTVLLAVSFVRLPETHPPHLRQPLSLPGLFDNYTAILGDVRFVLLGLTLACNFAALFLYIASAPSFVFDVLHLGARDFGWLFVPLISGMMVGAHLSSRLAGRALPSHLLRLAFAIALFGAAINLALSYLMPPLVPWSVLPLLICGLGVSLAQPTITLQMLDRFPAIRGTAASMQVCMTLVSNALLSAVVVPLVTGNVRHLALTSAAFLSAGVVLWSYQHFRYRH